MFFGISCIDNLFFCMFLASLRLRNEKKSEKTADEDRLKCFDSRERERTDLWGSLKDETSNIQKLIFFS